MRDYQKLRVWNDSRAFVLAVYRETGAFPTHERFGLTAQLRRAAVSIASNIAEGAGRNSRADYARFLDIALGSASECDAQVILARDLGFMESGPATLLMDEINAIRRQLVRLRDSILAPT